MGYLANDGAIIFQVHTTYKDYDKGAAYHQIFLKCNRVLREWRKKCKFKSVLIISEAHLQYIIR